MLANGLDIAGGGARGAGLHLAGAAAGFPPGHGPVPSRPPVLGARRAMKPMASATRAARPLRRITPDGRAHRGSASRDVGAARSTGGVGARAVPQQDPRSRRCRSSRRALARAVPRARRARSSSTTTSRSRSRAAPTACTWARRRRSPRAARARLTGKLHRRLLLRLASSAARAAVAAGADYVAFGSVFPSPTKPRRVRAPLALLARRARRSACRSSRSAASRCDNAPQLLARRRRRGRGDLRAVRRAGHRRGARARLRVSCFDNSDAAMHRNDIALRARAAARFPAASIRRCARSAPSAARRASSRAAKGALPLGRRRQALHRLRRLLGPDDPRPRASRGGARRCRRPRRAACPSARRPRREIELAETALPPACRRSRWCGWCRSGTEATMTRAAPRARLHRAQP